jgi:putative membrane protein
MAATFAFLHHLAAFTLVAALAVQFVLLRDEVTVASARKLQVIDTVYGMAAVMLLIIGLGRVFHFEKGATYYFHTWTFIAKLSLFVLVGLLSILPTLAFRTWRSAVRQGQAPQVTAQQLQRLRSIVHLELIGVVLIILCAALMAKGIGLIL